MLLSFLSVVWLVFGFLFGNQKESILRAIRIDERETRLRGAAPALARASVTQTFE